MSCGITAPLSVAAPTSLSSCLSFPVQVLARVERHAEVATLNRPRALNALNTTMVERMYEVYSKWEADPAVACIVLKVRPEHHLPACGISCNMALLHGAAAFRDAA